MIVPQYWSEAKSTVSVDGKRRTFMRFGWSDDSEADAHEKAKQRVTEAAERFRSGATVRLRDHKVAYNGAEGLPIREEIIERHGDSVITRNGYGALCLNTPDVVFADIDVEPRSTTWLAFLFFFAAIIAGIWLSLTIGSWAALVVAVFVGALFAASFANLVGAKLRNISKDPYEKARNRIDAFVERNPNWLLRLYRTPKGYRVLVMHSTFDPVEEAAFDFMKALGSDPLYMRMCRNQKCFRARISPKPWRIDIEHIRPRPGIWPIKHERMGERREWVRNYERKAEAYSACRFETTIGKGNSERKCDAVRKVHDRYCKADRGLPIA